MREKSDRITTELQKGRSRKEIFDSLVKSAPADAAKIAYSIGCVPENNLRKRYIRHNALLYILLIGYAVLSLLSGLPIESGEPTIFLVITTIIPLVFSYFVFRFHGGGYRLAGIWFLIDLFETLFLTGVPDGVAVLKLEFPQKAVSRLAVLNS